MEGIKKDWWQSSNFWTAVVMIIAGSFVGFTEEMAQTAVGAVFGIVAAGKALHNYFKSAEVDVKSWVLNSNFLNYALIVISTFTAAVSPQALDKVQQLVESIFEGDISGILAAGFSVLTVVWNLVQSYRKN